MAEVACRRCGETRDGLERPPYPGPLGELVLAQTCSRCWAEWQEQEVKVINELRLNFMDPESAQIIHGHAREFLALEGAPSSDAAEQPLGEP